MTKLFKEGQEVYVVKSFGHYHWGVVPIVVDSIVIETAVDTVPEITYNGHHSTDVYESYEEADAERKRKEEEMKAFLTKSYNLPTISDYHTELLNKLVSAHDDFDNATEYLQHLINREWNRRKKHEMANERGAE